MMTRVQILPAHDQDRRLEALAAKRRESKSKLIRRALDLLLRSEQTNDDTLLQLIGQAGRGRRRDVSKRHDLVLAASERARNRPRSFSERRKIRALRSSQTCSLFSCREYCRRLCRSI
jgi:Arc/MetJ-type ribon-helix-helix transcriptional regulator